MEGFYKLDINRLLYAKNRVNGKNYTLDIQNKDNYVYPINGWYWFDSEEEANVFFNIPPKSTSPVKLPNYLKFWDTLIASSFYQVLRTKALNSLQITVVCTEFVAALSDAKIGRGNPQAIQNCIWLLMMATTFTESELLELNNLLINSNLSEIYTLSLPEQP